MTANDRQVDGSHYKTSGLQHWDVCAGQGVGYLEGCASKYLMRWREKNGLRDLKKAEHFMEKLIEMIDVGAITKNKTKINGKIMRQFYLDAKIAYPESMLVDTLICWTNSGDIKNALKVLREMIDEMESGPGAGYVNQE